MFGKEVVKILSRDLKDFSGRKIGYPSKER